MLSRVKLGPLVRLGHALNLPYIQFCTKFNMKDDLCGQQLQTDIPIKIVCFFLMLATLVLIILLKI